MIKCICDRCEEKEYKPTDHGVSTIELKVNAGNHQSWPYGKTYNLCNICTKEFEKFMEKK